MLCISAAVKAKSNHQLSRVRYNSLPHPYTTKNLSHHPCSSLSPTEDSSRLSKLSFILANFFE